MNKNNQTKEQCAGFLATAKPLHCGSFKKRETKQQAERLYTVELEVDVEGLSELEYWSKDVWAKNPSYACSKVVYETKKEWLPQKVDVRVIECVENNIRED